MAKTDNCKYEYRPVIGKDSSGKSIRKSFYGKSKRAAKEKADKWMIDHAVEIQTNAIEGNVPTFGQVVDEFCARHKLLVRAISHRTRAYHLSIMNEQFRDIRINKIKTRDVQKFMDGITDRYAQKTLKSILSSISQLFSYAIKMEYITGANPCNNIQYKSPKEEHEKSTYTQDEADKVMEYCRSCDTKISVAVDIMLSYGTTMSETLGIQHADIDYENKTISIVRGVTYTYGKLYIDKPKNENRKRTIAVSQKTLDHIKAISGDAVYLFWDDDPATPVSPVKFRYQWYNPFMQEITKSTGVRKLNPHELRHTRATLWVEQDINLFAIAEEMGWSDLQMLKRVYGHPKIEKLRTMLDID